MWLEISDSLASLDLIPMWKPEEFSKLIGFFEGIVDGFPKFLF